MYAHCTIENRVAVVRLLSEKPEVHALRGAVDEVRRLLADESVCGIIIAMSGSGSFSYDAVPGEASNALATVLSTASVPVAAAVSGQLPGEISQIALACHFRFAAPGTVIAGPPHGSSHSLDEEVCVAQRLGISADELRSLSALGGTVTAEDAQRAGLARIADDPVTAARDFLISLVKGRSLPAIRAAMISINNAFRMPEDRACAEESRFFLELVHGKH